MKILLFLIELFSALALIVTILLHSPKGEGLAGIGGQARLFSHQKGLEAGLDRVTAIIAIVFLVSAATLGFFV